MIAEDRADWYLGIKPKNKSQDRFPIQEVDMRNKLKSVFQPLMAMNVTISWAVETIRISAKINIDTGFLNSFLPFRKK